MPNPKTQPETRPPQDGLTRRSDGHAAARAVGAPSSWDEATRTLTVVATAGAAVERYDWWDEISFIERLEVSEEAVDLSRLNSGRASVLDTHHSWDLRSIIGVVRRAWVEGGEVLAEVQFSERAEIADLVRDIASGIISNVSIGYAVSEWEIKERGGKLAERTAKRWSISEISFVPVPADPAAGSRSAPKEGDRPMSNPNPHSPAAPSETRVAPAPAPAPEETRAAPPAPEAAPASDPAAIGRRAIARRAADIGELCARYGRTAEMAALIEGEEDLGQMALRFMRAEGETQRANGQRVAARVERDEGETRRRAMEDALLARASGQRVAAESPAHEFYRGGLGLQDLCREIIEEGGASTRGMDRQRLIGAALIVRSGLGGMHTTTDFAQITGGVLTRRLQALYAEEPITYDLIAERTAFTDFREHSSIFAGGDFSLLPVEEHGELKDTTMVEGKTGLRLGRWGRGFAVTFEAIVNDDLNVFSRVPQEFVKASRRKEGEIVWGLLNGNPVMGDGVALFHASHGNTVGGTVPIEEAGVEQAVLAMSNQQAPGAAANAFIGISPDTMIVPSALNVKARKFLAAVTPTKTGDVNIYQGAYTLATERLIGAPAGSNTRWYLLDSRYKPIEAGSLVGYEGPQVQTFIPDGDALKGVRHNVHLFFGAGAVEHRGVYRVGA